MYPYTATPCLLEDRTILITGAGQGIGKAIAISCASLGAKVILLGKTSCKLQMVADLIISRGYLAPILIPFDLATDQTPDYVTLAKQLASQINRLDGLLHNASIAIQLKTIATLTDNEFKNVMQVNVNGAFSLTRHLLPLLYKSNDASIIFTSSTVGRKGRALWGAYATSKFATEGLMQCLADELKDTSIRVNSINPGATRTAMRTLVYPNESPISTPLPEQILAVYHYLLGPDSKGINGQALNTQ